jgi:UDP-glucose:(heptosyl)LPS alpha-1,3-glucosyltransferase
MRRFAVACAQAGHAVTIFTRRWDGPEEPLLKIETVNFKVGSNHGTIKKMARFVRTLRQSNTFDCITGFNRVGGLDVYFGGDVCLKAKLLLQHKMWLRFLPRYFTYLRLEAAALGPKSQTDIMLISPIEVSSIQPLYQTPSHRIHLLPPGIDRDRLAENPLTHEQRDSFRETLGVGKDDFLVLTVGSSFRTKGIDRVIQAIANLPEELKKRCRYAVVGRGDTVKFQAAAQKARIADRVFFTGGRRDIANFYHSADVLVHPARTETTGAALLEAMVTGLPVIVTSNCGYATHIQKAFGGLVCPEPFNQKNLNLALKDILANDLQRVQYGKNAFEYCKNADIYSMIEEGVKVILSRAQKNRGER